MKVSVHIVLFLLFVLCTIFTSNILVCREVLPHYCIVICCLLILGIILFGSKKLVVSLLSVSFFLGSIIMYLISNFDFTQVYSKMFLCIGTIVLSIENKIFKAVPFESFVKIILVVVLVETVWGFCQFCIQLIAREEIFITGSFDNPVGFAFCLVASVPFLMYLYDKSKHKSLLIMAVFISLMIVLSASRTCQLALMAIIVIHIMRMKKIVSYLGKYKYWIAIFIAIVLAVLYLWKMDSFHGRLLIWRGALKRLSESPFVGYGIGGFEKNYMPFQADVLQHMSVYWRQLADDIFQPFNEWLRLAVEFGVIIPMCILFFLAKFYIANFRLSGKINILYLELMTILVILSFFSYPMYYPISWCIIGGIIGFGVNRQLYEISLSPMLKMSLNAICVACFLFTSTIMFCYYSWGKNLDVVITSQNSSNAVSFQKLYAVLKHETRFLYNYAVVLNRGQQFESSLFMTREALAKTNSYKIQLLMADNYRAIGKYQLEEECLQQAAKMCPNRFIPLYFLVKLYDKTGRKEKALQLATNILRKDVKVPSLSVGKIKYEMYSYTNK